MRSRMSDLENNPLTAWVQKPMAMLLLIMYTQQKNKSRQIIMTHSICNIESPLIWKVYISKVVSLYMFSLLEKKNGRERDIRDVRSNLIVNNRSNICSLLIGTQMSMRSLWCLMYQKASISVINMIQQKLQYVCAIIIHK